MAKYCTQCGQELKAGENCNCNQKNFPNNKIINDLLENTKNIFVKPIDTLKNNAKENKFISAIILVAIMSVIAGVFIIVMFKNCIELFTQINRIGMYGFNPIYSPLYIEIPYIKLFFTIVILTFALSFAYVGILYLVNTFIFKGNANYKQIYSLYGVATIVKTASLVLASLLAYVNIGVALIVLLIGSFINLIYMYHSIKFIGPKDENKHPYIYLITTILYFIVICIITELFI